jgi:flagellar assembly factor FliW
MKFKTTRFGDIEVAEDVLVQFERGLPGFPTCRRFVVMEHDRDTPLRWLVCVDEPDVAFLVVEPEQVLPSFELDIPREVLDLVGWKPADDPRSVAIFLILNVDGGDLAANLRAPVVVNLANRRAHQLVLDGASTELRHPIRPQ